MAQAHQIHAYHRRDKDRLRLFFPEYAHLIPSPPRRAPQLSHPNKQPIPTGKEMSNWKEEGNKESELRETWLTENFPPTHFMQRPDGTFSVLLTRLQRRPAGMPLVYPSRGEAERAGLVEMWEAEPTSEETQVYEAAVGGEGDVEGGSVSGSSHTAGRTPEKSEKSTFSREELSPTHFEEFMAWAIRESEASDTERRFTSNLQMDLNQESKTQVNPAASWDDLARPWSWKIEAAQVPSLEVQQDQSSNSQGGGTRAIGARPNNKSDWTDLDDIIRRSR